jgi:hypothetical protein
VSIKMHGPNKFRSPNMRSVFTFIVSIVHTSDWLESDTKGNSSTVSVCNIWYPEYRVLQNELLPLPVVPTMTITGGFFAFVI